MTGMTVQAFDGLYEQVFQRYEAEEEERQNRPERKRQGGAGHPHTNSVRDRLLMTLIWLRVYPTQELLGLLFSLHKSNVGRNLKEMMNILVDVSQGEIVWPMDGRRHKQMADIMAEFPDVRAIVDATEQAIRRPKEQSVQKTCYSGKKKRHTLKTQIVVAPDGLIREVSDSVAGSMSDISLLRQTHTLDRLAENEAAMFDAGYQGVRKDAPDRCLYHPQRASRGHPLTDEQKAANRVLSHYRIVVEHTLAQVKRFQVLAQVYRHDRDWYNVIFRIVAGLANRRIAVCPLVTI
jgi:hypothetical protein